MTALTQLNRCLNWLTAAQPLPTTVDGIVLCGNSLPVTARMAGELAQRYDLPAMIIAGGVGHATKYLRQNLNIENGLSEAALMTLLVRQAGYLGQLHLDHTSTNSGSNATNARQLAPNSWHHVLLVQDPLLARRTALTFQHQWPTTVTFTYYQPQSLTLDQLPTDQVTFDKLTWDAGYFTELVLGECQRLIDTPTGYGPLGRHFIDHVDVPSDVITAYQQLNQQALDRRR
ncbi:YdcF family protein [Lactiplantibacillus plajomi]|uniref:YdcF family protein n=1 Tax=Lactiplantibacillus plajomi TaxID=1457217 RepID=A0ABV6K5U3_9LACO|nr:YdcF family protein [Lactiplantibacillus plajomi]